MPDIFLDTEARFCWNLLKLNVEGAQERKEDKDYTILSTPVCMCGVLIVSINTAHHNIKKT